MKWIKQLVEWVGQRRINPKRVKQVLDYATGTESAPHDFTPDLSLIHDYATDLQSKEPAKVPYIDHYSKGSKHLYYMAAGHEFGTDSPTHKTIRYAVENYKPDLIIIEGIETQLGTSPAAVISESRKKQAKNPAKLDERAYAAVLGAQASIPFIGGEPAPASVSQEMQKAGYSASDMMGFYTLRMLPYWREQEGMTESNVDKHIRKYLDKCPDFKDIPRRERLKPKEFKNWYNVYKTADKPLSAINTWEYPPRNSPNASDFERMSYTISAVREKHLDTTISEALKNHNKILVVYGNGHLAQSRPVFEKMFAEKAETLQPAALQSPSAHRFDAPHIKTAFGDHIKKQRLTAVQTVTER